MPRFSPGPVRPDEQLIFFPTIGRFDRASGQWQLPIHGWIFKPEEDSRRRAFALSLLRRWLHLDPADGLTELFQERLSAFLVDNQPRRAIEITINGQKFTVGPSGKNGHLTSLLALPAETVDTVVSNQVGATLDKSGLDRWLHFEAVVDQGDARTYGGRVRLLDDEGTSVVSDIDDTIKISHVRDRRALLRQTFLRDFEPVPGMNDLYARWRMAGAAFHYVSRSPWQLYTSLASFLDGFRFPQGTYHMRFFRWKEGQTLRRDRHGNKKLAVIDAILQSLPQRKFVLVGDSGEHDPAIYAELARRYPHQVARIFIRNTLQEDRASPRFDEEFSGVPRDLWQVFDEPTELPSVLS